MHSTMRIIACAHSRLSRLQAPEDAGLVGAGAHHDDRQPVREVRVGPQLLAHLPGTPTRREHFGCQKARGTPNSPARPAVPRPAARPHPGPPPALPARERTAGGGLRVGRLRELERLVGSGRPPLSGEASRALARVAAGFPRSLGRPACAPIQGAACPPGQSFLCADARARAQDPAGARICARGSFPDTRASALAGKRWVRPAPRKSHGQARSPKGRVLAL